MKIDHIAVAFNSKEESDKFFVNLLSMKEVRAFVVSEDLMENFFGVKQEQKIVRYSSENLDIEVFITEDKSKVLDRFTHSCLVIEDRDNLIKNANRMGYDVIKIPRKNSDNYYLFIRDSFGNLYEIKSP